jgi:hypothetical protein
MGSRCACACFAVSVGGHWHEFQCLRHALHIPASFSVCSWNLCCMDSTSGATCTARPVVVHVGCVSVIMLSYTDRIISGCSMGAFAVLACISFTGWRSSVSVFLSCSCSVDSCILHAGHGFWPQFACAALWSCSSWSSCSDDCVPDDCVCVFLTQYVCVSCVSCFQHIVPSESILCFPGSIELHDEHADTQVSAEPVEQWRSSHRRHTSTSSEVSRRAISESTFSRQRDGCPCSRMSATSRPWETHAIMASSNSR